MAEIGLIGLGVMGKNLVLNIERNGFSVAVYNRSPQVTRGFLDGAAAGKLISGFDQIEDLLNNLQKPRRIILLVPAGDAVDALSAQARPYLEAGDILIDGGNSHFLDTERRSREFALDQLNFIGMGISGGEEGALLGPSLMPGGQPEAWEKLAPIFKAIAARAEDGEPCVSYIGPRGAGHFVKMVHNGIEYADMQLISETYDLLHRGLGLTNLELAKIFQDWNQGELRSYLIEITANIFAKMDDCTGLSLLDMILDEAQQKGTGKWTSQNALDIGAPIPTINAALECRILSGLKTHRENASQIYSAPPPFRGEKGKIVLAVRKALYASKVLSYAQGMDMLRIASGTYEYHLNLAEIARIWQAGCIIRADILKDIKSAFVREPGLSNLLFDATFRERVENCQQSLRVIVQLAAELGIPMMATNASLAYFDTLRSAKLPANLIQAQRDYFGAHTYNRVDRDGKFHTKWIDTF
jgi:6-phosphogluconate dehydrogenase